MRFRPLTPAGVTARLVELVAARPGTRTVRVVLDGAPATGVHTLADCLVEPLRVLGRPTLRVHAESYWRDASPRLEWGREDEESYYGAWLDDAALRRELLDPLGPEGDGSWLPSLRDPVTNRSTRAVREVAPPGAVLLLSGALLLVHDLPLGAADVVVHVTASAAALARRTPEPDAWTLPVFARYDREVEPARRADVVVRVEDPQRPALAD